MDHRETLVAKIMDMGGRLRVRSALNPVLWLCAIVTLPIIATLGFATDKPWWLVSIAAAPVIVALGGFVFLLLFDRDKLQSEEYQIRKRSLELIEQKGDLKAVDAMSAILIENPDTPKLSSPDEGNDDA